MSVKVFKAAIYSILLGLGINQSALAECHFKTSNAIACTTPNAAAYAYQAFGFDIERTNHDYNVALMQQSFCGRSYGRNFKTVNIKLLSAGRIATPHGWVGVSSLEVNNDDLVYVASDYIAGTCEKFKPTVITNPGMSYGTRE
jgi:hypothetical protein